MKTKHLAIAIASLGCAFTAFPGAAQAGELEEMKVMLQKLQSRIDQLEAQKAAAPAAPAAGTPAVAAGNPALFANSNVTLYGKLDLFTEYDARGTKGTRWAVDSGGLNGSRWGVKGGADINPDIRGIFQVEGGFYANQGASAQGGLLFGRQAYAGVQGKFGTITAGRQYSPMYNTVLAYDPFEQGYGSPTNSGQVTAGTTRYDSSLVYAMPKLGDFSANAMVASGNDTGSNKHRNVAVSATYAPGAFGASLAYQNDDHIGTATAVTHHTFGGLSYQLGKTKLMGGIAQVEKNPDTGAATKRKEWMIGTKTQMTSTGTLLAIYGHGKTDSLADKTGALAVGWVEALSAQANVYGILGNHTNSALTSNVPKGTNSSGSYTINPGDTALGLALGFQYTF